MAAAVAVGALPGSVAEVRAQAPAPSYALTFSPATLTFSYPDKMTAVVSIHISTGAAAQSLTFRPAAGGWPDPTVAGSPIAFGQPSLSGPGAITSMFLAEPAFVWPICLRGDVSTRGFDVNVPADSTTTVMLPVTAFGPPWPGTDYTPKVAVTAVGTDNGVTVGWLATMLGKSGVHIRMRIAGKTRPGATGPIGQLIRLARSPVVIAGATDPPVSGALITVNALGRAGGKQSILRVGVGRTDSRGRFRLKRWRPPATGTYRLTAIYGHPAARLVSDNNCDLAVFYQPLRRSRHKRATA